MGKYQFGTAGWVGFVVYKNGTAYGGTIDLTSKFQDITWEVSTETVSTTSGNVEYNETMTGMSSFSSSITLLMDDGNGTAGTADLARMTPPVEGLFLFGNLGTASGKPKYGGLVTVTSQNMENLSHGKQDPVKITMDMEGNGKPWFNHGSTW